MCGTVEEVRSVVWSLLTVRTGVGYCGVDPANVAVELEPDRSCASVDRALRPNCFSAAETVAAGGGNPPSQTGGV